MADDTTPVRVSEKLFWSDRELATLLGISERKLQQDQAAGLLPDPEHFGRRKVWNAEKIRLWVKLGRPSGERFAKMEGGI